ncbi:MAG: hypothetical protein J6Y32_08465 [Bacteroidales bacterium]|nr:hypothetical protein [Bacteroidales bacterium]
MKDIGSIFPLYSDQVSYPSSHLSEKMDNRIVLFSLCREAIFSIAETLSSSNKTVLLPAYTCDTVITPFKELGWSCVYYPIDRNLRIGINEVRRLTEQYNPSLLLVHPFYGMDLSSDEEELLLFVHRRSCKIIVDITQCIFTTKRIDFIDFYVGSYRKWFPIPDGGFLEAKEFYDSNIERMSENSDFVSLQTDSMLLRGIYYDTGNELIKSVSRRINAKAAELIDHSVKPHGISTLSYSILATENKEENQKTRLANFQYLYEKLPQNDEFCFICRDLKCISSAPLYFPVFVKERTRLQRELAAHKIYAPVLWPVVYEDVLINDTIRFIYDHILAIPIDQRYDSDDMNRIVSIVNRFYLSVSNSGQE